MDKATDKFVADLASVLGLPVDRCERLAEILDERMRDLADERTKDALDFEFQRGDYRRD